MGVVRMVNSAVNCVNLNIGLSVYRAHHLQNKFIYGCRVTYLRTYEKGMANVAVFDSDPDGNINV